jgi:hypothetical protein
MVSLIDLIVKPMISEKFIAKFKVNIMITKMPLYYLTYGSKVKSVSWKSKYPITNMHSSLNISKPLARDSEKGFPNIK